MAVIIQYNGVNPFTSRPPEEVSCEIVFQDNNGYISQIDRYTISGTRPRPACNTNFAAYKADMDALLAAFRLQFKKFEVIENGSTVFESNNCIVNSISFPETNFKSFYRYAIVIDCYRSYQSLGIENPEETYETSQNDSGITNITHNVSCRGVGPKGVESAIAFIDSRKDNIIPQAYAESAALYPAVLTRNYSINRLTAEVSLTTTYVYNEDGTEQYCTLTYTCELQENEDSTTITIQGNFQGNSINGSNEMDKARARFNATDWQALAQTEWQNFGGVTLLGDHIQFSVNENPLTAEVSFTLTWDTNTKEGVYIQENWTVSRNYEGEPTCFTYRGVVKTDFGCIGQRFEAVKALANSTNWQNRIAILWSQYGTGESLSSVARSQSRTESPFAGTISVEITYCHDPTQSCGCFENMDYNLSFEEPIEQYVSQPILRGRGRYATQDLGLKNRRKFSISGQARRSKCCTVEQAKSSIKTRLNFISSFYFNYSDKILEAAEMEATDSGDTISFNYGWSAAV